MKAEHAVRGPGKTDRWGFPNIRSKKRKRKKNPPKSKTKQTPTQIRSGQTIIELPTRTKVKTFQRQITDYRIHNFYSASSVALNMPKNYYTDTGKQSRK